MSDDTSVAIVDEVSHRPKIVLRFSWVAPTRCYLRVTGVEVTGIGSLHLLISHCLLLFRYHCCDAIHERALSGRLGVFPCVSMN